MASVLENTATNIDNFVDKQKYFIEKKLLEAEQHNAVHPTLYSAEEIRKKLNDKYGI